MSDQTHDKLRRWLLKQLQSGVSRSLEAMTAKAAAWELLSLEEAPPPADPFYWRQSFNVTPEQGVWVGSGESCWTAVGGQILRAAGIDEYTPDDARDSYLEVLQQGLSSVAQSLTAMMRREVLCQDGSPAEQPPPGPLHICRMQLPDGDPVHLTVCFPDELLEALLALQTGAPGEVAAVRRAADDSTRGDGTEEENTQRTLDLFYDVELPIAVSFGRAHLPLREVLKLTSGSIVELNRAVSEPVEIIVNNCVIARGEVVVVEGNYGVRINQIVSRRERLRTLY